MEKRMGIIRFSSVVCWHWKKHTCRRKRLYRNEKCHEWCPWNLQDFIFIGMFRTLSQSVIRNICQTLWAKRWWVGVCVCMHVAANYLSINDTLDNYKSVPGLEKLLRSSGWGDGRQKEMWWDMYYCNNWWFGYIKVWTREACLVETSFVLCFFCCFF